MSLIINLYKKSVAGKNEGDEDIPLIDPKSLSLTHECFDFVNSIGTTIKYYFYQKEVKHTDKVILFCHGIGASGHKAYIREIDELCSRGYKVLTLDYTGCGDSGGGSLTSMFIPTRDLNELLNHLKLKEEVILMGHSLGGFTALNIASIRKEIDKCIVISPLLSLYDEMIYLMKYRFIAKKIMKYEQKLLPDYASVDVKAFIKNTNINILFIQSKDDVICPFKNGLELAMSYHNPKVIPLIEDNKNHNPNYTIEAVNYMNSSITQYRELIKKHKLKTTEERFEYFKNISAMDMTTQDKKVWDEIFKFLNR